MAQPRNVNLDGNVVTRDEDYKNSVRTLLEKMAGAGFKRKREIDLITLHEMRKPKTGEINRYTLE